MMQGKSDAYTPGSQPMKLRQMVKEAYAVYGDMFKRAMRDIWQGQPGRIYFAKSPDEEANRVGEFMAPSFSFLGNAWQHEPLETVVGDLLQAVAFFTHADYGVVDHGISLEEGKPVLDHDGDLVLSLYQHPKAEISRIKPDSKGKSMKKEPAGKRYKNFYRNLKKAARERWDIHGKDIMKQYREYHKGKPLPVYWDDKPAEDNNLEYDNVGTLALKLSHLSSPAWKSIPPEVIIERIATVIGIFARSDKAVVNANKDDLLRRDYKKQDIKLLIDFYRWDMDRLLEGVGAEQPHNNSTI